MMDPKDCKKVLKAAFLAFRPLCLRELSLVTGLLLDVAKDAADKCGLFITITGETVNLIYLSAKDYLKDKYTTELDSVGVAQGHAEVIERSLHAISSLEQNMYKLGLGPRPENMPPPDSDPLAPLRYSCVFWVDHLCAMNDENL